MAIKEEASVFLYKDYYDYLPAATLIASGNTMGGEDSPISLADTESAVGNYLLVKAGGFVSYITVCDEDSSIEADGGQLENIVIEAKGALVSSKGSKAEISNLSIAKAGIATIYGTLTDAQVGGRLNLYGVGSDVEIASTGSIYLYDGADLSDVTLIAGQCMIFGGTLKNVDEVKAGGAVYQYGGTISEMVFNSGSTLNASGVVNNVTFHKDSVVRLSKGAKLTGTINAGTVLNVLGAVDASEVTLNMLLAERAIAGTESPIISNWSKCSVNNILLTTDSEMEKGSYALAAKAGEFKASVELHYDEDLIWNLAVGQTITYKNEDFSLNLDAAGNLTYGYYDFQMSGSGSQLTWNDINGAAQYEVILENQQNALNFNVTCRGIDFYGLDNGKYSWQVRNVAEEDNWQIGAEFTQNAKTVEPKIYNGADNELIDVMFVTVNQKWNGQYYAKHMGNISGWSGTGEKLQISGLNRLLDIFNGSDDATVLMLSDEGVGDALFVDDIYSASVGTSYVARLSKINDIYAGAGDDIVDLTSMRFAFDGGVGVHGGDGDDVIWANSGENLLFGDAGDDRLVGASGNDLLAGGIGNDSIHCGGGNDIVCFCKDFGEDKVEQLLGGKVTLWFAEGDISNWNKDTLTYDDGDNSVTVTGVIAANISLKFGDDGSEQYDNLVAVGAFAESTSQTIFEKTNAKLA